VVTRAIRWIKYCIHILSNFLVVGVGGGSNCNHLKGAEKKRKSSGTTTVPLLSFKVMPVSYRLTNTTIHFTWCCTVYWFISLFMLMMLNAGGQYKLNMSHKLLIFPPQWHNSPSAPRPHHCRGFTITLRHTTLGRTPLDEWSARRRDL
jgi:hypothetical protein